MQSNKQIFRITSSYKTQLYYAAMCWHYSMVNLLKKILTKDTPYLACEGEIWGVFVSTDCDIGNTWLTEVLHGTSCHIGLRYNGTWLYIDSS